MMATSWKPTLGWLQSAAAGALLALLAACGGGGGGGGSSTTITPPADTTPPTVVITDDVTAATATGPVTLRFGFSEDVGTSFDSGDVVVTSGTAGAFTRIDGTAATLVVTPAANTQGALGASIAAGAFRDLAGNANAVPALYARAFDTTLPTRATGGSWTGPTSSTAMHSMPRSGISISAPAAGATTSSSPTRRPTQPSPAAF
jgi:hypothetical protein